jgi:hypothetical protein
MPPAPAPKTNWWVTPLAVLASSALVVAAILVMKPQVGAFQRGPAAQTAASNWEEACGGDRGGDFKCFQQHYQTLIRVNGVAAAFTDIKAAYDKSATVKGECHQLVHVIGRAAADKLGNVAAAYDQGDDFCWSGYYHGVMEAILAKIGYDNLESQINSVCQDIGGRERYSFFHYNCVHGLGHGVMVVHNNELFKSLTTCDAIPDNWERESCFGGVFMENIMSENNPDHATKYLKKEEPLYPCPAVDTRYKQQCYLMQTSYALQNNGYDFPAVFKMCDNIEVAFRPTCYQSLGRDASGQTISDPVRTRDYCMIGKDFEAQNNCITGAVKDFIAYFHDKAKGDALCNTLEPALREPCLATAESFHQGMK